ncbi:GNAT family N-acetyltransferase [Paucilactobacillus hokkaidonensis]|nr:GNAT family N-acetyltransferase [Paucilactobacillus hokkaidonensis]
MDFKCKAFDQLSSKELFAIYQERVAVFVVEQECAYQEVDPDDLKAYHLFSRDNQGEIVAYARLIPTDDETARLGRVLVNKKYRQQGHATELVTEAIKQTKFLFPKSATLAIQAQYYLRAFYASFGAQIVSEPYLEDNIKHVDMTLKLK